MRPELSAVKALTFDVFGTVVDWRSSIARETHQLASVKGLRVNAARFADAWRAGYRPAMDRVSRGELPWTKIDVLHRMILDAILEQFRITTLSAAANRGLKTGFVRRPREYGRNNDPDLADDPSFSINSNDFNVLADQLGC